MCEAWLGPDGTPLPLSTVGEIEAFLMEAEVLSWKTIGTGVTQPKKVLLEEDGIRMHAIFRSVDIHRARWTDPHAGPRLNFRDSCFYECAAYQLSKLLGLRNVPPVVRRRIRGESGTLQIWIENAMMEVDRLEGRIMPPDTAYWSRQHQVLKLFDQLIYNDDRNLGNLLIDKGWNLWFIDHTRSFRIYGKLARPEKILSCERDIWEKLQSLEDREIRIRLAPYLRSQEIKSLLKRRAEIVERLNRLIQQNGTESVLFTLEKMNSAARGVTETETCSRTPG
jgi:hypothetical protein